MTAQASRQGPAVDAGRAGAVTAEAAAVFAERDLRLARLTAEAFGCPFGIAAIDGETPVAYVAPDGHAALGRAARVTAAELARNWREPPTRTLPVALPLPGQEGTAHRGVALPAVLRGRPGWLAALGPTPLRGDLSGLALSRLVAALEVEHEARLTAQALWIERLEYEHALFAKAQAITGLGIVSYDFDDGHMDLTAVAQALLGGACPADLDELAQLFGSLEAPLMAARFSGADGDRFDVQRRIAPADALARWLRVQGLLERHDGRPAHLFLTLQNVTDQRTHMSELRTLAETDTLTGVFNRTVFETRMGAALKQATREARRAALLVLDIDEFKHVNDTFGHPAGDEVLRLIATFLTHNVRDGDTVVRLAGDEFAVVLGPSEDAAVFEALAERIRAGLTTAVPLGSRQIALSCSVGLAVYPDDVSGKVDIYKAADHALFEAKSRGKGRVQRFDPNLRERQEAHRLFIASVRHGLENGEFKPYFQPQLDLASGAIVGFEALVRWEHPSKGVLTPGRFYKAFDDPDIGGVLSDVTLDGAFAAVGELRASKRDFGHVSINLNAAQLSRLDLVAKVLELAERHDVEPREVSFEVLENVLIRERRVVYQNLTELARHGFKISLDDFGTGYASLTSIREPFITEVKIDRSFITFASNSVHDQQIVSAIVQMARKMGLTMVAEGIEDEETLRQLRALGCTVGQGYVFANALPLKQACAFVGREARIHELLRRVN